MRTLLLAAKREDRTQNLHDMVVGLLTQYWTNPARYNITTNPGPVKNRWVGTDGNYPDLVGWVQSLTGEKAEWIAEVETSGSVTEIEAREQWARYDATGVPFYLIVPAGYGTVARNIAARLKLTINGFYEFTFSNGKLVLNEA